MEGYGPVAALLPCCNRTGGIAKLPNQRNEQLMQTRVPAQSTSKSWLLARPRWLMLSVVLLIAAGASTPLGAQVSRATDPVTIAPEALPSNVLQTILQRGLEFESSDRWGEALTHYEEALRSFPSAEPLQQKHNLAKLQYSIDRRYHDRSFLLSIRSLNTRQALSLYSELLRKINTHYVQVPSWSQLVVRGTTALDIALADRDFLAANSLEVTPAALAQLRSEMYQTAGRQRVQSPGELVNLAAEVARLAEARLGLRQTATILEFITAAAGGLDDYSAYLTSDQLRDVYSQIEGNFVGLGVELKADNGALLIVHVIPGSPAEKAGIRSADRIVAVDGKTTAELSTDEAAALLTGEEGTMVRVTAYSPGSQPRILNVRRAHVEVPSLEGVKIIEPDYGVAYVRIPSFQKTTSRDLEAALWKLHRQDMKSLILDLRGNPGGLLTSSVELADKFLTQGNIVSTRGRSPQEDFNYQAHYGGTWRVPLVVLIDGDSASASEIFAGAIKDNGRGTIVGNTSFGKGSVQGIFPLGYSGAGVRLTTAKFYSPNGSSISNHGVAADIRVQKVAKPTAQGLASLGSQTHDPILEAGIQAAQRRAAAR